MPSKLQTKWDIHSDNSQLRYLPPQQQINDVYQFCSAFSQYQCSFIMLSYNLAPHASLSQLTVIDNSAVFSLLIDEIYKNGYVLMDTLTDYESNYKGVISFVLLAFNNKGYVVDGFLLHKDLRQLKKVVEDPKITKYCYKLSNCLEDVKRDWKAFGMNFFNFQLLQKSIGFKKSSVIDPQVVSERPFFPQVLQYFQQRYDNMIRYLHQIRYFLELEEGQQQYSIFSFSNHYQFLLKEYQHKQSYLDQQEKKYNFSENEKRKRMKQNKENNIYYDSNEETQDISFPILQNNQQKYMCQLLIHWRQHMAKMLDCPPKQVLTFQQILIIAIERPNSIFQIQETFEDMSLCTVEKASNILQLISFAAEQQENLINQLQIRQKKNKEEKNIKSLLIQLKWQGREEWLNRKNDESIRLYKEIVSIVELDGSIVQQFKEGMAKGVVSNNEIGRFVKYAEYFRNCNHKKLKQYYDSNVPLENNFDKNELFGWSSSDDQQTFITGRHYSSSQTSIASSCEKILDKNQNHTLPTIRCPSSINSLTELDFLSIKVEALPENIQQIYLKAVSVKKNYQKIQKKKLGRKQGKDEGEQFVPSWQQIKILLQV